MVLCYGSARQPIHLHVLKIPTYMFIHIQEFIKWFVWQGRFWLKIYFIAKVGAQQLIFQRCLLWVASWAVVLFVQVNWIKITLRSLTWFFCEFINKWTKSKKSGELFTFYNQMLITHSAIIVCFFNVYLFIWLCWVLVVDTGSSSLTGDQTCSPFFESTES